MDQPSSGGAEAAQATPAVVVAALGGPGSDGAGKDVIQQAGIGLSWSCTSRSTRSEGCHGDGIAYGRVGRLTGNFCSVNGSDRTFSNYVNSTPNAGFTCFCTFICTILAMLE